MKASDSAADFAAPAGFIGEDMLPFKDYYIKYLRQACLAADPKMIAGLGTENSLFFPNNRICNLLAGDMLDPEDPEEDESLYLKRLTRLASMVDMCSMDYCWRLGKNLYRVDCDALTAILSAPLPERLCLGQLLSRSREYCIYISLDWQHNASIRIKNGAAYVKGLFVQLNGSCEPEGRVSFSFACLLGPGDQWFIPTGTKGMPAGEPEYGIVRMLEETRRFEETLDLNTEHPAYIPPQELGFLRGQALKILAYIISDNHDVRLNGAEIDWSDRDSMRPKAKKVKGGFKFFPLNKNCLYEVGRKLGDEVRARVAAGAAPGSIKGHFTAEAASSMKPGEDTLKFALDD